MKVWVQLTASSSAECFPIRIFRTRKAAYAAMEKGALVEQMDRSLAVDHIRREIYNRQNGKCSDCKEYISWEGMHMHEKVSRGKFGEISLDNSTGLCYDCHINGAHGERAPQFGQK